MSWDFETEPEFQEKLDWVDRFVREEVEPLDMILDDPYDKSDVVAMGIVKPLQQQVRDAGLWACHLGPELGGSGPFERDLLALERSAQRMNHLLGCR